MFESSISKGEEKHKTEVKLCEMADHVVAVGPKLSQTVRSYFLVVIKMVTCLWPHSWSIWRVWDCKASQPKRQATTEFGRGDVEDLELKGFDIAGKAIAELQDTRLVFVGAPDGKHEEIANRLIECGVPASRLRLWEDLFKTDKVWSAYFKKWIL